LAKCGTDGTVLYDRLPEGSMDSPDFKQFELMLVHRLPALYRYALTLTGSSHDAEDLVQEALVRTGVAWPRVRKKDDPEGYVRTVMVRVMVSRWRRPNRERLVAEPPERPTPDRDLDKVGDDGIDAVLAQLPPRMRAVLVLRYVDQLSNQEIADVMGCSLSTVKSQASRALAKLRAALAPVQDS
jgi:RNA polymerase sigma-70 factor (sigma-E family)